MHLRSFVSALLLITFVMGGCSRSASPKPVEPPGSPTEGVRVASVDVVKVTTKPLELSAGGSAEAVLHLNIKSGYHINANPPTYSYLRATELDLQPVSGISVSFVVYPNATSKNFPFAEKPLAVYEGDTQLKVLLKAAKSAPKGASNLAGRLKVQACDDQVCYPPGTIDVAIPVNIK